MVNLQKQKQDLKCGAQYSKGYHETKKQIYPYIFQLFEILNGNKCVSSAEHAYKPKFLNNYH